MELFENYNQFKMFGGGYSTIECNKITISTNPSLKKSYTSNVSWNNVASAFPYYRIYYILDGEGILHLNKDSDIILKKDNLYLISPFQVKNAEVYRPIRHYFLHFNAVKQTNHLLSVYQYKNQIDTSGNNYSILFNDILTAYNNTTPKNSFINNSILNYLISLFIDESREQVHINHILAPAVAYIEANITEKINIPKLAQIVHLTPNYFSTLFKKIMGTSPSYYILEKKLNLAATLILNGEMNITEISNYLNFTNSIYFSSIFKKYFGSSPQIWKKKQLPLIFP